jgi:transketolase
MPLVPDAPRTTEDRLDQLAIYTIRTLAIDAVHKANSGHRGAPLGAAPMAFVLWSRFLRHAPTRPDWPDRDRFVLSAGHASMLLYALLHLTGYELPLAELERFRQWGSRTPGHPEYGLTPGVEATTGPLGQGFANAVGMAIAERRFAAEFNRADHEVVDHWTYALCSDGDLQEGIASEAASLAGHLMLRKLVVLYDDNHVQLDGPTDMAWSEDVLARFEAYRWDVEPIAAMTLDQGGVFGGRKFDERRPELGWKIDQQP